MEVERRFLLSPAVVRLLLRERTVTRDIVEGYLSRTPERLHLVRIEPDGCKVLLTIDQNGTRFEDQAKVSRPQADAFLDVCQGRITYRQNLVRVGPALDVYLDQVDGLDLASLRFDDAATASAFVVPAWFGPEVTENPAYQKASLALDGIPATEEVPVSNVSIIAFLDALQPAGALARVAAVLTQDVAPEAEAPPDSREEVSLPAAATLAPPDERITGVLAGLSHALGAKDSAAQTKRAPFLVPAADRRSGA